MLAVRRDNQEQRMTGVQRAARRLRNETTQEQEDSQIQKVVSFIWESAAFQKSDPMSREMILLKSNELFPCNQKWTASTVNEKLTNTLPLLDNPER